MFQKIVAMGLMTSVVSLGAGCVDPVQSSSVGEDIAALPASSIVGTLAYGQTSAAVTYTNPPRYRAFRFVGRSGDHVDARVHSGDGDAMGWIVAANYRTLASNDDADGSTTDSEVAIVLPSDGTYYVAFREADLAGATFTVTLTANGGGTTAPSGGTTAPSGGYCYIEGAPVPAGQTDGCQICDPSYSTNVWANRPDGTPCENGSGCKGGACQSLCQIAGMTYQWNDANPSDVCQVCNASKSSTGWSNAADGTACGVNGFCQSGACVQTCAIPGFVNVTASQYNPANQCQSCVPNQSTTGWTTKNCGNTGLSCYQGSLCCSGPAPYTCADWNESSTPRYNGQSGITEEDGCGRPIICY